MNRYLKEKFFQNDGFTLIELLMVVIILGILAAVAIPQFSSSSTDAKVAALKSNLSAIRGAIEFYSVQHGGDYPTASILNQMTQYTDADGTAQATKNEATGFKYGPYIRDGFPEMPFPADPALAASVHVDETVPKAIGAIRTPSDRTTVVVGDQGWVYVVETGEFIANHIDYDDL